MASNDLKALKRALEAFPAKLQKKAIRRAARDGAKLAQGEVKAGAPVDTGKVRASVKVRAGRRKKNLITMNVEVTGGHPDSIIGFVEYGTRSTAPNPFIRRGFDSSRGRVEGQMIAQIVSGIESLAKGK